VRVFEQQAPGWSRIAQALVHAEEFNPPLALVHELRCATIVRLLRGEYDAAWRLAQKMDARTREHHFDGNESRCVLGGRAVSVHKVS